MPQLQVFQCPSCGANLSYDGGPELSFPCQFCGTTVVVPEELRPRGASESATTGAGAADFAGLGQMAGGVPLEKLEEMKRLAQNGRKIEAIKIYREITGVGLREAKEAVERLEAGQPVMFTAGTSPAQAMELANEVLEAARDAAETAQQLQQAGSQGSAYGGATVPPLVQLPGSPAPAMAPARRGMRAVSCLVTGCVGVIALGVAGVAVVMTMSTTHTASSLSRLNVAATITAVSAKVTEIFQAIATPEVAATPDAGATAQAKARSTQQAQAKAANATATRAAGRAATATAVAGATAESVAAEATAQAEAAATAQAIIATQTAWPAVVSDNFSNNQLGWPVGPSDDDYFSITTTVKSKKFAWAFVPKQSAYANAYPLNPKAYSDFSATVKVKFVQGGEDGNTAVGLVFRHADQDYGFFGIDPNGNYRIILAFAGSGVQENQEDKSAAIHAGAGQVNQLTVRAAGSDFIFQVNDEVVWQVSQDLPKGDFGLGVDAKDQGDAVSVEFTEYGVHAPKK